jgi:flagellar FliL protein
MSEDEENAAASAGGPAAAAAGKSKVLPLLLVINTLLLTGVLIFVMKRPAAQAEPEAKAKAEHGSGEGHEGAEGAAKDDGTPGLGPTLRFDNFTVQLKSADVDRYAHLSIEIEVPDEVAKGSVEKRVPPVRDAILAYLSDRTAEELRGSEGLAAMKESLIKKLDEIVPGHRIRALYITDFIIQ